jgi:hypothetical protein
MGVVQALNSSKVNPMPLQRFMPSTALTKFMV